MKLCRIACLLLMILSLTCCGKGDGHLLEDVDSYVRERPDSALKVLRTVDPRDLRLGKFRARYSLLFAMALDKNYIDTTDVSVIMPAVQYYSRHGDADEKLKAYFYLGRIYLNARRFDKAAFAYSLAEAESEKATDEVQKGILYMNISYMYNKVHNVDKELEYAEKGITSYQAAGDTAHLNLTYGDLAIIYHSKYEWATADSLYRLGLEKCGRDTLAAVNLLSNYAKMKMVRTNPDPDGAISLLREKISEYHRPLSVMDYGVYAYASDMLGDTRTCDQIMSQLESLDEPYKDKVAVWLAMIYRGRGDYRKALDYQVSTIDHNYEVLDSLLAVPVSDGVNEYYRSVANESRLRSRSILLAAVSFLVAVILLFVILTQRQRLFAMKERENSGRILTLLKNANEVLERENSELKSRSTLYDEERDRIRKSFASLCKDRFSTISKLCKAYLDSKDRTDKKDVIYYRVESLVASILEDDKLHAQFESQIDGGMNNMLTHLKEDLGSVDRRDERFICYLIAGFDPQTIATILNLSVSNVYTKKSRLRDRIKKMDSTHKDDYLSVI